MAEARVSPRFKYYAYQDQQFASMDELNALLKLILSQDTSWVKAIFSAVKIAAAVAVMWIRDRAITQAMELDKQGYMIARSQASADELARDPLDAERRPPA